MTLTHREIVLELFKMLDTRDYSVVKGFVTPDFRLTILPASTGGFGVPSRTWDQVLEFFKELDNIIQDYKLIAKTWIEAGDVLVAHYYSDGKLRSGSAYKNEYIGIFRFKDGKLDSFEEMMDSKYVEKVIAGTA